MSGIQLTYTWAGGEQLEVTIQHDVTTVEALASMRIEAQRLWREAVAALEPLDEPK